jgi:hypothetical protein
LAPPSPMNAILDGTKHPSSERRLAASDRPNTIHSNNRK